MPELQLRTGNNSAIGNQLLYQLCTRELLRHWHFYYWCLNVLGIGHGFAVTDTSRLWDHSFDPYSFTALDRTESKFVLLILSFQFQKQQPACRREKQTHPCDSVQKNHSLPVLVDSFLMLYNNVHCKPSVPMAQRTTCKWMRSHTSEMVWGGQGTSDREISWHLNSLWALCYNDTFCVGIRALYFRSFFSIPLIR